MKSHVEPYMSGCLDCHQRVACAYAVVQRWGGHVGPKMCASSGRYFGIVV